MMDGQEFVDLLKIVVRDGTARGEIEALGKPPGRRPRDELVAQSVWFNSLSDDDRRMLSSIIADTADLAVFRFLCVLDGVVAIEDTPDKGRLELSFVKGRATVLNPEEGEMLHDFW
ncbi:hypothetical protein [Zavarzinia sp.]|uniref:hypothetical protein n=1 Tax=Zavarzinia sp. TaxID=2027920 RepID=UPI0035669D9F